MKKWLLISSIVIGISLMGITIFHGYIWEKKKEKMEIDVLDGYNIDDEHGCFFILLACKRVHIDPRDYTFWVSEKGDSAKQLSFDFRYYGQDGNSTPLDGDRNVSYLYSSSVSQEKENGIWGFGQAIAFDMPHKSLGLEIKDQTVYGIYMKNKYQVVVWRGEFVYKIL